MEWNMDFELTISLNLNYSAKRKGAESRLKPRHKGQLKIRAKNMKERREYIISFPAKAHISLLFSTLANHLSPTKELKSFSFR
jgi:hypothetical protein